MLTASYNAAQRLYEEEIPDITSLVSVSFAAASWQAVLSCPAYSFTIIEITCEQQQQSR